MEALGLSASLYILVHSLDHLPMMMRWSVAYDAVASWSEIVLSMGRCSIMVVVGIVGSPWCAVGVVTVPRRGLDRKSV